MVGIPKTIHRYALCRYYGTAVGIINPKADYKVVIEAHADEISWFVKLHYQRWFDICNP